MGRWFIISYCESILSDEILPTPTSPTLPLLDPTLPPQLPSQSLPLPSKQKMEGITESVPVFHGKRDGYEDPLEYLETINFVVDEKHTDQTKALMVKRLVFRSHLRDDALKSHSFTPVFHHIRDGITVTSFHLQHSNEALKTTQDAPNTSNIHHYRLTVFPKLPEL